MTFSERENFGSRPMWDGSPLADRITAMVGLGAKPPPPSPKLTNLI